MSVEKNSPTFFRKLGVLAQKTLLNEMAAKKTTLTLSPLGKGDPLHLQILGFDSEDTIACKTILNEERRRSNQQFVANFEIKGQKYFFDCIITVKEDQIFFSTDIEICQLQRRTSTRLKVPEDYNAVFTITSIAGRPCRRPCRLYDISAGGIQIEIPDGKVLVSSGDHIEGTLKIGKRAPIALESEIRFTKIKKDDVKIVQAFGLMFIDREGKGGINLMQVMLEVQKELFIHREKKAKK
jgi:c-di-GMP-binding flagellar brake protein YcgR